MTARDQGDLERLGHCVRQRRQELGLTQVQVAHLLGWQQERLSLIEHGLYGMPSLPSLVRLAHSLDVSLLVLLSAPDISLLPAGEGCTRGDGDGGDLETLGCFVRERRQALGLTQQQLGQRVGWHQARISLLERGQQGIPSLASLVRLSQGLNVSLLILLRLLGLPLAPPTARRGARGTSETTAAHSARARILSKPLVGCGFA